MTNQTKIKICGLSRPCDIQYVNEAKPDYCGFIVNFPKSHRNVSPDTVRALVKDLDPAVTPVGVFVDQPVEDVAALLLDGTIRVAQLHGSEDEAYIASLRALAPGRPIWKAFKVRAPEDVAAANASSADLVLLDNGAGTGETFDWSLTSLARRPYLLAGGLTPQNLPQAIQGARPYGVDLSSGVETDKVKDRAKVLAAVAAARCAGV
jgi:phosphoribosylanthranilate isomerase